MEVVRLGERYSSQYLPDKKISGYSSMIFTERYTEDGDFELRTPKIQETMELLPEDTLISHLDTDCVMIVETHNIETNDLGRPELVVTGRDLTVFTDHRFIDAVYQKKRQMNRQYSAAAAVSVLLYQAFCNDSGKDLTHDLDKTWNTYDQIPNTIITDSSPTSSGTKKWWLDQGILKPQLDQILIDTDLAIRAIRPGLATTAQKVSVSVNPLSSRGTVTKSTRSNPTELRFDIYKGLNRSNTQTTNPEVSFSRQRDELIQPKYLFSQRDLKTVAEIMSSQFVADVYRLAGDRTLQGLQRRVMAYDAGEPDLPPASQPAKRTQARNDFIESATEAARRLMKTADRLRQIEAMVIPDSKYKFGRDYGLGDKVSVYGDYGVAETMVVSEYIRSEDANGDTGYPGLTRESETD